MVVYHLLEALKGRLTSKSLGKTVQQTREKRTKRVEESGLLEGVTRRGLLEEGVHTVGAAEDQRTQVWRRGGKKTQINNLLMMLEQQALCFGLIMKDSNKVKSFGLDLWKIGPSQEKKLTFFFPAKVFSVVPSLFDYALSA